MTRITYRPAWWLPGGHLMTLWRQLTRRAVPPAVVTKRLETPDGDFVDLLRLPAPSDAPRLLVLHGLEGSARSRYVSSLFNETAKRSWGIDLLLFRSCGSELNRTARFYHSGETGDLGFALSAIMQEFPHAVIALAGFSLGGNVLLKWLGEMGGSVPARIRAAAAVSVPFDLSRSADRIGTGFSRIYEQHFLRSLKRKALAKGTNFPNNPVFERACEPRTLRGFDDCVTAPLHGFRDARDYYAQSSALGYLPRIGVPTLLLSARDDPFLPAQVLREVETVAGHNRYLTTEFVERGGHVGFVGGRWPWQAEYYAERRIAEFCAQHLSMGREVAAAALSSTSN